MQSSCIVDLWLSFTEQLVTAIDKRILYIVVIVSFVNGIVPYHRPKYTHCCRALSLALARLSCNTNLGAFFQYHKMAQIKKH